MDVELVTFLRGDKQALWRGLLIGAGLEPEEDADETALVWDGGVLAAAGSRRGDLLKCIAVAEERQGEGLLATVLTALRQSAFQEGIRHLFLYTKPGNAHLFEPLFFYSVARTDQVLLMEDRKHGIQDFLASLPVEGVPGPVGAAVMHCDPFTLGHRYLIETAARECGWLYVFLLSEDRGHFSAADRREMVLRGTADLPNVTVLPTGPYLISMATFPTYFLKDRERAGQIQCQLDIEMFTRYFVPRLSITRRYVGTEPLSPMTGQYNAALRAALPHRGVEVRELPRLEREGVPVSASSLRAALAAGDWERVRALAPPTTFDYLRTLER